MYIENPFILPRGRLARYGSLRCEAQQQASRTAIESHFKRIPSITLPCLYLILSCTFKMIFYDMSVLCQSIVEVDILVRRMQSDGDGRAQGGTPSLRASTSCLSP